MTKLNLFEIESLNIDGSGAKQKCTGSSVLSINTEMINYIMPGKEMEVNGKITPTTIIGLVDENFHVIPKSYKALLDEFKHKK
jgi:hypothetical protein